MRPSCYLIESSQAGCSVYLGEVSTEECLAHFDLDERLTVSELSTTAEDDEWIGRERLSAARCVADVATFLRTTKGLNLIDITLVIGRVTFSTHDDGEAQLRFEDDATAVAFLRKCLPAAGREALLSFLLENRGCYVTQRGERLQAYGTFEEYLAGTSAMRE